MAIIVSSECQQCEEVQKWEADSVFMLLFKKNLEDGEEVQTVYYHINKLKLLGWLEVVKARILKEKLD